MARREYTAGSPTTLANAFNSGATSFTITSDTNWPTSADYDFFVTIDAGTAQEERVLCSARTGTTVTVATGGRGKDGTGEKNHAAGASVWPSWSAQDADEANAHIESSGYASYSKTVHGLGSGDGVVVGTTKTQTLTAKTLTSPVITGGTVNGGAALTVDSTELNYVDGVTSAIQTQFTNQTSALAAHEADTTSIHGITDTSKLAKVASASAGRTVFVQAATPTALATGDIWFQVTGL